MTISPRANAAAITGPLACPGAKSIRGACRRTFGNVSLNTYGAYPRTWNIEHAIEVQHELIPRLSFTGSWFHGSFHNLTTTINTSLQAPGDPLKNANYTPYTVYNPLTGEAITVYGRTPTASSLVTESRHVRSESREHLQRLQPRVPGRPWRRSADFRRAGA